MSHFCEGFDRLARCRPLEVETWWDTLPTPRGWGEGWGTDAYGPSGLGDNCYSAAGPSTMDAGGLDLPVVLDGAKALQ